MPKRAAGLLFLFFASCQDAALPAAEVPTFVKAKAPTSIETAPAQWSAGENWAWDVRWRGLSVGTARLGVHADAHALRIESNFRTAGMANDLRPFQHRLVTHQGGSKQPRNDLHSALGRLRSWASPSAAPARITLWHERRKYIVDLAQPILDQGEQVRLRVEGRVRSGSFTMDVSLLLSADASHTPLAVTLIHKGQQVHATLLESDS